MEQTGSSPVSSAGGRGFDPRPRNRPGVTPQPEQLGAGALAGPGADAALLAQVRANIGPPPEAGGALPRAEYEQAAARERERLLFLRRVQTPTWRR